MLLNDGQNKINNFTNCRRSPRRFMHYGEIVIGPPGSGKTTYILKKAELLTRDSCLINLDPGNDPTEGQFDYSISGVFNKRNQMRISGIGPNCVTMEVLDLFGKNIENYLGSLINDNRERYFIFDFPGQVEFFLASNSLKKVIRFLIKSGFSLVTINLVDFVHFIDEFNRISSYLISTLSMMLIETPQISVISKCDNIKILGRECSMRRIANVDTDDLSIDAKKHKFLFESINLINNMSILKFQILDIKNNDTILHLQRLVDIANGYIYEKEDECHNLFKNIPDREELLDAYSRME